MVKYESIPFHTRFLPVRTGSTIGELASCLRSGEPALSVVDSDVCLFTSDDLPLLQTFPSEDALDAWQRTNRHLASLVLLYDETLSLGTLLPRLREVRSRPILFRNGEGSFIGYTTLTDLLEYAAMEQQRGAAYFAALAETVTDAVTIVDQQGKVMLWNTAAESMYSLPRSDVEGQDIGSLFKKENLMVLGILDEGRVVRGAYHRSRDDKHVLINVSPVRDASGRIIGGIAAEQDISQLVRLNDQLTSPDNAPSGADELFASLKAKGSAIANVMDMAEKVAGSDVPVLLVGESGVGKQQLAKWIHQAGPRSSEPFLAVHCGITPAGLLEAELFGYQGGTFTGTVSGQPGKLEEANDGTLFISEIERLSPELQAKLYHTLKQYTVVRQGGFEPIPVRARLLLATTANLEVLAEQGEFRSDLYYMLQAMSIRIPPLRERTEDIPALSRMLLARYAERYRKPVPALSPEVFIAFSRYKWPGNMHELSNVIERCVILSDGEIVTPDHLPASLHNDRQTLPDVPADDDSYTDADIDIHAIREALAKTAGNKSAAAKQLGISRGTLYNKLKEAGQETS
ncbi:sigma-54 interaction domain-containing protein [Paenibacillus ginsengarvi]|uniref:PAS domain S-box protein n=1 Tax=Paenibacillus ginsengarvi TaxID=400777 RepID=A0A3B0CEB6_9BACL|nr:sigma 54-interacting transcriptional regulator [Paenibacillus ginsengarvi]RKN84415.1 PAS domain S-box protein [Paenibacillus ginsengarvi]